MIAQNQQFDFYDGGGLDQVRVAAPPELDGWGQREIANVGVCPGSGGSVFEHLDNVDLLRTGEMRHHDVLAAQERGCTIVLAGHTNTERGYLKVLRKRLLDACSGAEFVISKRDRDPLKTME